MEKNHFILKKVSRILPSSFSSCQFRSIPDVAEASITIKRTNRQTHHENDHSSFLKKYEKTPHNYSKPCKKTLLLGQNEKDRKKIQECRKVGALVSLNHSSSSYSGWFTNSDVDDALFSLSSNSGDSFRRQTSRRFRRCDEMKSIDETGRCYFSSFDTVLSKCSRKTSPAAAAAKTTTAAKEAAGEKSSSEKPAFPEYELGSDHISTQLYYNNSSGGIRRRRKTGKARRKIKKRSSLDYGSGGSMIIGESYAVEKSSSDPHGDFRASMVEMIVEKQIFGADELEKLLLCFLSLNATSYHGIIYDVFTEICQTLFSNN